MADGLQAKETEIVAEGRSADTTGGKNLNKLSVDWTRKHLVTNGGGRNKVLKTKESLEVLIAMHDDGRYPTDHGALKEYDAVLSRMEKRGFTFEAHEDQVKLSTAMHNVRDFCS